MFPSRSRAVRLTAVVLALGLTGSGAHAEALPARQDFNGDGYADLVAGVPLATVGGKSAAGYVAVMYGSEHGLSASRRTLVSRATTGIPGSPSANERFGSDTSAADLAAAAVREDGGNGAVWVLRGRPQSGVTDAALVLGGRKLGAPYAKAAFGTELR
jgi:hypothetical protein